KPASAPPASAGSTDHPGGATSRLRWRGLRSVLFLLQPPHTLGGGPTPLHGRRCAEGVEDCDQPAKRQDGAEITTRTAAIDDSFHAGENAIVTVTDPLGGQDSLSSGQQPPVPVEELLGGGDQPGERFGGAARRRWTVEDVVSATDGIPPVRWPVMPR